MAASRRAHGRHRKLRGLPLPLPARWSGWICRSGDTSLNTGVNFSRLTLIHWPIRAISEV